MKINSQPECCANCAWRSIDCGHTPVRSDGGLDCSYAARIVPDDPPSRTIYAATQELRALAGSMWPTNPARLCEIAMEIDERASEAYDMISEMANACQTLKYIGDRIDRTVVRDLIDRAKKMIEEAANE